MRHNLVVIFMLDINYAARLGVVGAAWFGLSYVLDINYAARLGGG